MLFTQISVTYLQSKYWIFTHLAWQYLLSDNIEYHSSCTLVRWNLWKIFDIPETIKPTSKTYCVAGYFHWWRGLPTTYLGHEPDESDQMKFDASCKRASPVEVLRALKIYSSSFYGAMLWDLAGEKARQVYNVWNVAVKLTWGCPRATRTFLLQSVLSSGLPSAKADLLRAIFLYACQI